MCQNHNRNWNLEFQFWLEFFLTFRAGDTELEDEVVVGNVGRDIGGPKDDMAGGNVGEDPYEMQEDVMNVVLSDFIDSEEEQP